MAFTIAVTELALTWGLLLDVDKAWKRVAKQSNTPETCWGSVCMQHGRTRASWQCRACAAKTLCWLQDGWEGHRVPSAMVSR